MNNQIINLALVGVARHGTTILKAIRSCAEIHLQACYDIDANAVKLVSEETGCIRYDSYDELLHEESIDGVMLVTPNHLHHEQSLKALQAGKHVFIEKPLAVTVAECSDIITQAKKANKIVQVGHNTRKRELFRKTKQLLNENAIGKIVSCHAHMSFDFGLGDTVPEWKKDHEKCPLLPMSQLGIHFVDALQYLIAPVVSVSCMTQSSAMVNQKGEKIIDSTVAAIQCGNGVIGTMQSHYTTPEIYVVEIYGTEGRLICCEDHIELIKRTSRGIEKEIIAISADGFESFIEEVREFAGCISQKRVPEITAEVGMQNVAVIEAMTESAIKKKEIRVQSIS